MFNLSHREQMQALASLSVAADRALRSMGAADIRSVIAACSIVAAIDSIANEADRAEAVLRLETLNAGESAKAASVLSSVALERLAAWERVS